MAKAPAKPKKKSAVVKPGAKASGTPLKARAAEPKKTSKKEPQKPAVTPTVLEPEIVDDHLGFIPPSNDEDLRAEIEATGEALTIDPDREIQDDEALKTQPPKRRTKRKALNPEIVEPSRSSSTALTTTDPITLYLAEIRKYALLTKEQEHELAVRYRETGDPKAAEQLVTSNLRFVVKVAAEYSRFGARLIDLIQEGNVGLMHAVKEFNPYKGVRLITYAVWWIRGYIQEYLMRQYSLVRIGTTQNQRKLFYRLQKEREALDQMGQEPNIALLAGRLGVSEEEVQTMAQRLRGRDISLNQPLDSSSSSTASLLDFESTGEPGVDETLGHFEEMEVLRENIEKIRPTLNEKETFILEKRVLADEPLTLQDIGDHFGTTREAVRQLEARLIGKIRAAVTSSLGED